jgi:hypothetical protein
MPDDKDKSPVPIFESYIYDFIKPTDGALTDDALGGGVGRPGELGGPLAGQDPKFRVFIYQYIPPKPPDIGNT